MTRQPDCIGIFTLLATQDGGRLTAVRSGYRPHYAIHENYQTSVAHEFDGDGSVAPGESAQAKTWFVTPHVYPGSLWPERVVDVFEGARRVGTFRVSEVLNPVLAGEPDSFPTSWSESRVIAPVENDDA